MTTIGALAAGAWLWGKFGDKVTEQVGKVAGDAGKKAWSKFDWPKAAERYRQEMQMRYGTMRILGMPEPVALADMYTDVTLLDKPRAWRHYNIDELSIDELLKLFTHNVAEELEVRRPALDVVKQHERLMILGQPGAGKTTLLKHLVQQCTTGKLDAIPILIGLKDWSDKGTALLPYLASQFAICGFLDAEPFVEHILAEGKALVLFDGLDEVNLEQGAREQITREVRDFANQYPRSRCVITCRTAASDYQFEKFVYCELADFTEMQIRTFIGQWFQRDKLKCKMFLAEFEEEEHDRLRDLARTPLLLTLLCLTFEETMSFPTRRAEIYEESLDALLKKWDATRSIKRDTVYRKLSLSHKRQLLARIAVETFEKNEPFIRQRDLTKRIEEYVRRLPPTDVTDDVDGKTILEAIESQHGILVERSYSIYSFSHLTFQEYFAARYIVEHPSVKMFRDVVSHAHDPRWREVLLLIASLLDDANAEIFFEAYNQHLCALIQQAPDVSLLFTWLGLKGSHVTPERQCRVRSQLLNLVLAAFNIALIGKQPHVITRAEGSSLAQALARARSLSDILVRAQTRTDLLARTMTHDYALDEDFTDSYNHIRSLSNALAAAIALDRTLDHTVSRLPQGQQGITIDTVWTGMLLCIELIGNTEGTYGMRSADYHSMVRLWEVECSKLPAALQADLLSLPIPTIDSPSASWQQFEHTIRTLLMAHLDLGQSWAIDDRQLMLLTDYLTASRCMIACLDLAAVNDRSAIRNRLLLPPKT